MLLAIWSVAVLAALPALWTMEYDSEKAQCVKTIHSDKIRRKVQRVRFLYCNSIMFICYWVPLGICTIFYEVTRKPSTRLHAEYPNAVYVVSILFFMYVMCLPLILLWTSDLLTRREKSVNTMRTKMAVINSDFSRCSTQGLACAIPSIIVTTEGELMQGDTQQVEVEVYV
ncbi:hypothetical protein Fcan01_20279 [Folsomia candida]|uniref:G-protein coupled receptors family 1 profile domain-containing protein n=1 Tax=Folsomia candida TaxID=158441 RepID=A0A226DIB9_FOLCA|nr:hypothetical protein Fcan01_20279 [Folsomia candida]